jgi:internalin A
MDTPKKRRWWNRLRISVGAFLALVLVMGVWLGLILRSGRIQRDAVAAITRAGGEVWYEWEYQNGLFYTREYHCPWPKWLVDHVGVDYLGNVIRVDFRKRGSDAELAHVVNLGRLEELLLIDSPVTDSGLAHLRRSTTLKSLFLAGTRISDSGLAHLKGLSRLEVLSLADTAVTDAGLAHLNGLSALKQIHAGDTQFTASGVAELRKSLPGLGISRMRRYEPGAGWSLVGHY